MKKILILLFTLVMLVNPEQALQENKKTVTVTTSFLEDIVKNIAGDIVHIELVVPKGADPHLYAARPSDLKKIKSADLLLYHGLNFEGKLSEILEKLGFKVTYNFEEASYTTINDEGLKEVDPHFWFDIELYKKAVENTSLKLIELMPENENKIKENTLNYIRELDALYIELKNKISEIEADRRILVTPHDAFNYFARSFSFTVVAPQGVSTESEVSNADIDETVNYIVKNKVKAIFAETTTNPERIEKLKELCRLKGFEVKLVSGENNELFSDSLAPDGHTGDTYLSMYRHNVNIIVENLR